MAFVLKAYEARESLKSAFYMEQKFVNGKKQKFQYFKMKRSLHGNLNRKNVEYNNVEIHETKVTHEMLN